MVLVVAPQKIGFVSQILRKIREPFYQIGKVVPHSGKAPRVSYL
jgi:hypothetical protein